MYRNSNENIQDDQMNYAKAYKPTRITSFTVCSVSYAGELSHFSPLLLVIFHNFINAFEWYTKECCTSELYFLAIHTNV